MKEIQLTQGKVTLVDDEDFDWLNQYSWRVAKGWKPNAFYAKTDSCKIVYLMHRMLLGIHLMSGRLIKGDHKDFDGLNNQRENLRVVTPGQNNHNKAGVDAHNSSGVTGVYWSAQKSKWHAEIRIEGVRFHLGFFDKIEDAAAARKQKEKEIWQTQ